MDAKMLKIKQFLALALAAGVLVSHAADTSPAEPTSSWLSQAQKEIKANNYSGAIVALEAANQVSSADWNHLLGYAQRKKTPPDLAAAERFYQAALKIDPNPSQRPRRYGFPSLYKATLCPCTSRLLKAPAPSATFALPSFCRAWPPFRRKFTAFQRVLSIWWPLQPPWQLPKNRLCQPC
jgi:tetratricopeptide (TPR) repeat protein